MYTGQRDKSRALMEMMHRYGWDDDSSTLRLGTAKLGMELFSGARQKEYAAMYQREPSRLESQNYYKGFVKDKALQFTETAP